MVKKMKIALNELGSEQWTGGITYINNLLKALAYFPEEAEVVRIRSKNTEVYEEFKSYTQLLKFENKSKLDWMINGFSYKVLNIDRKLGLTIKGHGVDVVFPVAVPANRNVKSIYWIPDFQFVHLPHLFDSSKIKSFDKKLRQYFNGTDMIIVSSEDAKKDLVQFSPEFIPKVRVLKFVAHVPQNLYSEDTSEVKQIYHLPQDFFYLPNQFWAHKNHSLVVEALKILKIKGIRPLVVCSGNPTDERNPMFFANFLKLLSESGVREQFVFLGMIPHNHVYSLIRGSNCVINPSLFEGWSTSVEECKSVGKGMILSDLPVHFEQNPANSYYFKRNDPNDLAEKIEFVWKNISSGPDRDLEFVAREKLPKRMKEFGKIFLDICSEVLNK